MQTLTVKRRRKRSNDFDLKRAFDLLRYMLEDHGKFRAVKEEQFRSMKLANAREVQPSCQCQIVQHNGHAYLCAGPLPLQIDSPAQPTLRRFFE